MLTARIMMDDTEIGDINIVRLTPHEPEPGTVCRYAWFVIFDGDKKRHAKDLGLVEHTYGDSAATLLKKVLEQAGY